MENIQETLYIGQWLCSSLWSRQAPWDHTQFYQSPSAAPLYLPESHQQSEISSLSKVIVVLGKARSHRAPNLSRRGLSHLGDLTFCQKSLHEMWWMNRRVVVMKLQSPGAHSCRLLNHHRNSFCRGMFKPNRKSDSDSLLYPLSHFEWDGHAVHMLPQQRLPPPLTIVHTCTFQSTLLGCQLTSMSHKRFSSY